MDAVGAQRTTYLSHDNIAGYDDTYVQNPAKHPMEDLSKLISDRGLGAARIGFEMDNYYFTASAFLLWRIKAFNHSDRHRVQTG